MKNKLQIFVEDMNEILYEKDPDLEEYPLIFATNGYDGVVAFNGSQLFEPGSYPTWPEILTEIYNLSKVYASLHKIMKEHFRSMLNKEIEEKYGLGIVIEGPTTPLSERNHPMV